MRGNWIDKFGIHILEGYSVTRYAPVVTQSIDWLTGQRGQTASAKVSSTNRPVPGIEEGRAALHIKGPNIMKGYLLFDRPGVLQQPDERCRLVFDGLSTSPPMRKATCIFAAGLKARQDRRRNSRLKSSRRTRLRLPRFAHATSTRADAARAKASVLFTTAPELTREQLLLAAA